MVPRRGISRVSQFMDKFTTYGEDEYIEIAHNLKEVLVGLNQRIADFFLFKAYWYSKVSSRIRAVRDKRNVMVDVGNFLSPFSIVGLCFLAASCSFSRSRGLGVRSRHYSEHAERANLHGTSFTLSARSAHTHIDLRF